MFVAPEARIGSAKNILAGIGVGTKAGEDGKIFLTATKDISHVVTEGGKPVDKILFKAGEAVDPAALTAAIPGAKSALSTTGILNDAGEVVKDLSFPSTLGGKIRAGDAALRIGFEVPFTKLGWHGPVIGGRENQAKAADYIGQKVKSALDKFPRIKAAFTSAQGAEKGVEDILGKAPAENLRSFHNQQFNEKKFLKESQELQKSIRSKAPEVIAARAARTGEPVESMIARAQGNPLPPEVDRILHTLRETSDNYAKVVAQGGLKSHDVLLSPKSPAGARASLAIVPKITKLDEGLLQDVRSLAEAHEAPGGIKEANRARTGILKKVSDEASHIAPDVSLRNDYAKLVAKPSAETAEKVVLGVGKAGDLRKINEAVKGFSRSIQGSNAEDINLLRNQRQAILQGAEWTPEQKIATMLTRDARLLKNKIGDILEMGGRKDIDNLIKLETDPVAKETLLSSKNAASTWAKITKAKDLWKGLDREKTIAAVRAITPADLFDKLNLKEIRNFYHFQAPVTEFVSKAEVGKRTAAIKFWDSTVSAGLDSGVMQVQKLGEPVPEGYKAIDFSKLSEVPTEIAAKEKGESFEEAAKYHYVMREDLYNLLQHQGVIKAIEDPVGEIARGKGFENFLKPLDWITKWFKASALALSPTFYTRNLIDDFLKMSFEGSALDGAARGGASKILALHSPTPAPWQHFKGDGNDLVFKTVTGDATGSKLYQEFLDRNVMGTGVSQFGQLRDQETAEQYLRRYGILSGDKMATAKELDTILDKLKRADQAAYDTVMKAMAIQEKMEEYNRLTTFLHFRKTMSAEDAAQRTKLVHFDYDSMTPFEKQVLQRVFPFYAFKKGISKYLATLMLTDNLKLKLALNAPNAYNELFHHDEKVNPGILPDYLKDAYIQVGKDEKGNPKVIQLKGLSSFFEVIDFFKPWDAAGSLLNPAIKTPIEMKFNKDTFFNQPIEQYEGQKRNVLGIPTERRGAWAAIAKNIRPINFLTQVTESTLKDTPYSVFGTKEKRSFNGALPMSSTDRTMNPQSIGDMLLKQFAGVPITTVDVARVRQGIAYEIQNAAKQYKQSVKRIAKDYPLDPSTMKKEIASRTEAFTQRMQELVNKQPEKTFLTK